MKKVLISFVFFVVLGTSVFGLSVDSDEVKLDEVVNFINYSGNQITSPAAAIKGIGVMLSRDLSNRQSEGRYHNKYRIIHALTEGDAEKLDADIIYVNSTARVNHIGGMRLILAGYLEDQYGYSLEEARVLAFFITVYNAVYRGDLPFFQRKYNPVVLSHLSAEHVGLAINYAEWAGKTELVIPLIREIKVVETAPDNNIDTSTLSDDAVIEVLKTQEDRGVEERADLVEFKEQELEEDRQDVETAREELDTDKAQLEEDKAALEEQQEDITVAEEELQEDREALAEITDDEERAAAEEELQAREEELNEQKEEAAAEEDRIAEAEEAVEAQEDSITAKEEDIAEREEALAEEKEELETDQRILEAAEDPVKFAEELIEKEEDLKAQEENLRNNQLDEKTFAGKFYYLRVDEWLTGGHYNNSFFILNANTGEVLVKSPVGSISGREYDIAPSAGVVVITHKGSGSEFNYISILDLDTLELKFESEDPVFHRSFVEVRDNFIYIIANLNNSYFLGKYNLQLERVALSTEKVDEDSFVTFYGDRIYINDRNKDILALDKDDLSLIEKIFPE